MLLKYVFERAVRYAETIVCMCVGSEKAVVYWVCAWGKGILVR